MNTGLPCRLASENGLSSIVVPLMSAAAKVWNPEGGTVTCVVSMLRHVVLLAQPVGEHTADGDQRDESRDQPPAHAPTLQPEAPFRRGVGPMLRRMLIRAAVLWEAGLR